MSSSNKALQYQSTYLSNYGFESVMVEYRRAILLERLKKYKPNSVIEIGCGSELQYQEFLTQNEGSTPNSWLIVEPADAFASVARASKLPNLHVIQGFFEQSVSKIKNSLTSQPDMVICSSLLHEVASAPVMLAAIREVMSRQTILHVNVPNSESFHRRLAQSMGMIGNTKAMSKRNTNLLQHRVYDMKLLKDDLTKAGFTVIDEGGYLIKPFTHEQMEHVSPYLGESVMDGLFKLGRELPDLASEIWIEAVLDNND